MAPVFVINSILKLAKSAAYVVLFRDARLGRVQGVSWKSIAALAASATLGIGNLETWYGWIPLKEWALANLCAWAAAVAVYQRTNVRGLQDDILGRGWRLPSLLRGLLPSILAMLMALVVSFMACKFSMLNLANWMWEDARGFLCTFQNFMHGTALLPQLMVSRDDQFVAPAAAKFLLVTGILHIYELVSDLAVSWIHYEEDRLDFHEISFLSGDLFAAVILMDFLYLVATSKSRKEIVLHSSGLPVPV
mmetsp:Transcript_42849/g.100475  ORF Transcript_42849/g.100475 Transcript_42849/m.100475 type:complete len:249 (-) Transcript_42849:80-826(-)